MTLVWIAELTAQAEHANAETLAIELRAIAACIADPEWLHSILIKTCRACLPYTRGMFMQPHKGLPFSTDPWLVHSTESVVHRRDQC